MFQNSETQSQEKYSFMCPSFHFAPNVIDPNMFVGHLVQMTDKLL